MPNPKPPVFNKALLTQVIQWIEENPENTVLSEPLKTKLLRFQELNENEQAQLGNELQMISQLPNIINNFMGFASPNDVFSVLAATPALELLSIKELKQPCRASCN
jgi:nitrate reductase NapAB chaperone NapD